MIRYLCILLALLISLSSCAVYPDAGWDRLESLPQHYTQFDLVLGWRITGAASQTVVEGELANVRYAFMEDIALWVAALDASGKTVARSAFLVPHMLRRDEVAPFRVKLPVAAVPGTRLRFTYMYHGSDGGDEDGMGAVNWMQSFETLIPDR